MPNQSINQRQLLPYWRSYRASCARPG